MKKGIKNAIVWGDSVACGVVLDTERERYHLAPSPAANIVGERLGLSIQNRSRMGLTSSDGLKMMRADLARGLRADVAILEFGGNDCNFDWQKISENPSGDHHPKISVAEYESNIRSMIGAAIEVGMKPILVNLPPINAERYLQFISRNGLSKENILHWLGDQFQIYRFQEHYSMIVTRIARECECRLLDIRSAFLNVWNSTSVLFCRDGIHPSEEGQRLMGDAIVSLVSQ